VRADRCSRRSRRAHRSGPVDGDPELLAGLVLRKTPTEQVEEESLAQVPVLGRVQRIADGPDQGRSLAGAPGKDLLGLEDVGSHERAAVVGDMEIRVIHLGESEDLGRIDQGEQVVHLERQLMSQLGQVLTPAVGNEDLEEPRHAPTLACGNGVSMGNPLRARPASRCGRAGGCPDPS